MSESTISPTEEAEGMTVDAFAFFPNQASRIRGLGGREPPNDPAYAFHTAYMFCKPGKVVFSFHIEGLAATSGNLTVRVHSVSTAPGASPQTVKMLSYQLPDLADEDGRLQVSFAAKPATMYAVLGVIYGTSDAHAMAMSAVLDKPDDGTAFNAELAQTKYTEFGASVRNDMSRLQSDDRATLAVPVSQMATASQFDERAYRTWLAAMGMEKIRHRKQWELVYILQALSVYGMIQPGARGLGFALGNAAGGEVLPAILAARGCEIVATDMPSSDSPDGSTLDREALRRPDLCPDARFDAAVSVRTVDVAAIPQDLRDFDFCWSAGTLEHLGEVTKAHAFVARSLECLKVGGFAIHTSEIDLTVDLGTFDQIRELPMRRRDFERLALDLIAEGHLVAQFKFDQGKVPLDPDFDLPPYARDPRLRFDLGDAATSSFGLIVQRGEG